MTITLASKATSVKRSLPSIPEISTASGVAVEAQTTLVIIDSGVEDYSVLAAGVLPNIKTVILDPHQDGVAQITKALQAHPHTTSLHIVSHGSPGCLYLGNTQLSLETLDRHSWDLQSWFSLLPNDSIAPSLLLYGCEAAKGERGQTFIYQLGELTGAGVAASDTKTGSAALGGQWDLNITTGKMVCSQAFTPELMAIYPFVLAPATIFTTSSVSLSAFDAGWYTQAGSHDPTNTNTYTEAGYRSFFVFNQPGGFTPQSIVGAQLRFFSHFVGADEPQETFQIREVTTSSSSLIAGTAGVSGFTDLGDGPVFGSYNFDSSASNQTFTVTLNSAALPYLQSTASPFVFGGSLSTTFGGSSGGIFAGSSNFSSATLLLDLDSSVGAVKEDTNVSSGQLSFTGKLAISDPDPGEAQFSTAVTSAPGNLGALSILTDGNWTYNVSNSNTQFLGAGVQKTETFTVRSSDGSASQNIIVTITGVNDAPALISNATLAAVAEDTAAPSGSSITTLFGGAFSDPDTGSSLSGVAVVGNTANATTTGKWQYSTNGGTNWFDVGVVADGATALALPTNSSVRFVAVANYNGTPPVLTVRALDNSYAGSFTNGATRQTINTTTRGGSTAITASANTISTSITSVNDAPTGTANATLVAGTEDTVYTINATNLLQGFSDVDGDTLSVSGLTATNGTVVDNADGTYSFTPTANYNGLVNLTYNVIDGNGGSVAATQSFSLAAVNDAANIFTTSNVSLSAFDGGWYGQNGDHTPTNPNTYTGIAGSAEYRSFFVFSQPGGFAPQSIVGAQLRFFSHGVVVDEPQETFQIREVITSSSSLIAGTAGVSGFTDLGDGSVFGSYNFNSSASNQTFTVALNGAALSYLQGAASPFVFGGSLSTIPGGGSEVIFSGSDVYSSATLLLDLDSSVGAVTEDTNVSSGQLSFTSKLAISDPDPGEAQFSTAVTSAPGNLGSLSILTDGNWTYNVSNSNAQFLGAGVQKTETFTVQSLDGSASQDIIVTITGVNDAAVIGGTTTGSVTEDGTLNASGTLTISDPDAGEANFVAQSGAAGTYGSFNVNTAGVWNYTANNSTLQSLKSGQSVTDIFTVSSADGTTQAVTITVNGTNDAAVIGGTTTGSVTEDGTLNASGMLTISDADTGEANFVAQTNAAGTYGSFNIDAMGDWSYAADNSSLQSLTGGQSVTDIFTVSSADGTTQAVTITVNGTNDAAVIGGTTTGNVTEDGTLNASGMLTISDADTGEANFVAQSGTTGIYGSFNVDAAGAWSYAANNSSLQSLNGGQSVTDTFTVSSADGTTQAVTITVNGISDTAVIGGTTTGSVTEDGTLNASGTLTINDPDAGEANFVAQANTAGTYGSFNVNTAGAWSYAANNSSLQSLNGGQSVIDTFTVSSADGTTQAVTITVNGTNDAPSLTSNATLPVVPEDSTNPTGQTISSLVGTFFSDPDAAASLSGVAVVGNTANAITEGKWQHSTDGATWTDVGPVTDSVTALALSATTQLRFLPVADYNGAPAALTIRALDNTYSGGFGTTVDTTTRGGSTAIAAATNTISTSVLPSADVTSVSATTLDGAYNAGDAIAITVTFDEIVNVTGIGIPQLTLETGTTDAIANYSSGSGTNTLTFLYTVGAGETSVDLDYLSTTALSLNGGSIRNASGIDANLTLPTPGAANSLGANKSLVIDTTAPAIPAIASFTTDSGVAGDNITNDTTLSFSGTAEANSTVTLTLDGTAAGTVVADQSGNWTYTPAVLSEGTHTLSAIATDAAGNSSAASPVLSLLIDTTAPTTPAIPDLTTVSDTGRSNTDNITNDTTPTFNGTAEANSTVSVFSGTTLLGRAIADPSGSWTFTAAALASGSYSITTQVMDAAGNTSAPSPSLALTIDTAAPTAPLNLDLTTASDRGVSSTDNKTSETKPTFTGAAEANSIVELFAGTQSLGVTTTDATGNWSFSVPTPLSAGSYNITTQATDVAGNASPSSTPLMLTIQTVVPTVSTLNITPDVRDTNVGIVSLQFSEAVTNFDLTALTLTHEGVVISLVGAILTSEDNRTWVLELPSALTTIEGRYQLSVSTSTITSTAGNPLAAGTSDTWLVGYTATAFAPIDFQGERLTGIRIRGSNESERFEGTFRSDLLMGMGGNDVLIAGFGKAQFGVDRLYGGNGNDILISGNGKDLLYGERGRDRLLGGNGSDYLDGGSDGDRLLGGKGNDVLVGGTGNDMLSGKAGKDTFVCNTLNEGMDIVTDFNGAEDLLDLRNIMRQSGFGGDNAFARFTQYVQLHQVGANTEVRIDTDGNRSGQDFTTVLTLKNTTLSTVNSRQFVIV